MSEEQVKRGRGRPKKVVEVPAEPEKKAGRPKKLSIAEKEEKAAALAAMPPEEKAPKRGGGRKKNENYLPYAEAREIVQAELLHSRGAFDEWFKRENPKTIPRFPYRVYTKEWTTWNDFLGTNNEFRAGPKAWRQFDEAVLYVHTLQLKTQKDWLDFCKAHADQVPDDIPRRPDVVYDKWTSWNHWLGNKPAEAIIAKQESSKVAGIYYIIHEKDVPGNVITYGVEPLGIAALKERWENAPFDVVQLFSFEPDRANDVKAVVDALSTPYLGDDAQRITPNVWQIVEVLQTMLMSVRR